MNNSVDETLLRSWMHMSDKTQQSAMIIASARRENGGSWRELDRLVEPGESSVDILLAF